MQKIISFNRRSVIAIALCMTFLLGYMPFSTDKAYAADGSITLKVGRDIEYSSHHTHYFYARKALFTVHSRSFPHRKAGSIHTT